MAASLESVHGRVPVIAMFFLDPDLSLLQLATLEPWSVGQKSQYAGFWLLTDRFTHEQRTFVLPTVHFGCYLS